jgi:hypothetical protein
MASPMPSEVKSEDVASSSAPIMPQSLPTLPTSTSNNGTSNSQSNPAQFPTEAIRDDGIGQSTAVKAETLSNSIMSTSAPIPTLMPIPTKTEEGAPVQLNGSHKEPTTTTSSFSSTNAMDIDALPVKEELSKTSMALDSPISSTQADFDADPALWGLRRSVSPGEKARIVVGRAAIADFTIYVSAFLKGSSAKEGGE